MIKKIIKKQNNMYGNYFLVEAPGDPGDANTAPVVQTVTPANTTDVIEPGIKPNTKVIDVKYNRRGYANYDLDDNIVNPVAPANDPIEPAPPIDGGAPDQSVPAPTVYDPNAGGVPSTSPADIELTSDFSNFDPNQAESPVDQLASNNGVGDEIPTVTDTAGNPIEGADPNDPNAPDIPNSNDFDSDPMDGDNTGGEGDDTSGGEEEQQKNQGAGIDYDSTRKYSLFLNFQYLINALNGYIEKLEKIMGDDSNINKIIKTGNDKLKEIKDLCYEYIMMKFEFSSYTQSRLFYQNAIVMVQEVFTLFKKSSKYMKQLNK